jgi:hypothetical protein
MIELVFRCDLYAADALQSAIEAFRSVAVCEVSQAGDYHRVRLTPADGFDASRVIGEFRNFVLGATIEASVGSEPA